MKAGSPSSEVPMAGRPPPLVTLSDRQRELLETWVRATSSSQQLVERCRIVLLSAAGVSGIEQAEILSVNAQRVWRWRRRWSERQDEVAAAEAAGASASDFRALLLEVLGDNPRSGTRPKFSAKQVTDLIALACEDPADSGLPGSHWTSEELRREAMERGIVAEISARQVRRFLARRAFGPTSQSTG